MDNASFPRLTDRAVVRIAGADRLAFLQGLVTNDVAPLSCGRAVFAGMLTPQGKIAAEFILHPAEDAVLLDVRADAADALARRLTLYRLRALVEIEPTALAVVLAGADDPRLAALGPRGIGAGGGPDATAAYHARRIALGVPELGEDFPTGDAFPHEAGWDMLAGLSFTKGCYVGQEIVARMQHRGTARTRPVLITGAGVVPGAELVASGTALGRIGSASGGQGIALVRLDRLAGGVHAGGVSAVPAAPHWAEYALTPA